MQLWQMLGRKVNNLGRVVDGERNASLGAQKAGKNGKGSVLPGISVQEELQSFFAETHMKSKDVPKIPVKGTIMSFFASQKQKTPQSSGKVSTNTREESAKESSSSFRKPCNIFGNTPKQHPEFIEWDCKACTFHNKQRRKVSGVLTCEMCGTKQPEIIQIDDFDILSHRVTPLSADRADPEGQRKINQASQSSISQQKNKTNSRTKSKIVTIDEIENQQKQQKIDVVPRKLDSSLENPIILCNSPDRVSSRRKRRKMNTHEARQMNVSYKDGPTTKSTTLLSFSVSKNSGRITIHFSNSGESSHTNFKVTEILDENTVDRLLEAQLSRNHNTSSIKLVYNQTALKKGKQMSSFKPIGYDSMRSDITKSMV